MSDVKHPIAAFCSVCGGRCRPVEAGWYCKACGQYRSLSSVIIRPLEDTQHAPPNNDDVFFKPTVSTDSPPSRLKRIIDFIRG